MVKSKYPELELRADLSLTYSFQTFCELMKKSMTTLLRLNVNTMTMNLCAQTKSA